MKRSGRLALCALLLVAAPCGGDQPKAAPADSALRTVALAKRTGPQGRVPQFLVECQFSHFAPDDPIVWPNQPGRSHSHTFVGNDSTDAASTVASLDRAGTTCKNQLDRAAYWAPTLYDHRKPVVPDKADAYYRPGPMVDPTTIKTYPHGLKIVSGDHTRSAQPPEVARWSCGTSGERRATAPECPKGRNLRLEVVFPDCWNGVDTDSADHRSHMARSVEGVCPQAHPVPVPQLMLAYTYPISGPGHDLLLASGTTGSAHADFFNAWDPDTLAGEITSCLHREVICGVASNRPTS